MAELKRQCDPLSELRRGLHGSCRGRIEARASVPNSQRVSVSTAQGRGRIEAQNACRLLPWFSTANVAELKLAADARQRSGVRARFSTAHGRGRIEARDET